MDFKPMTETIREFGRFIWACAETSAVCISPDIADHLKSKWGNEYFSPTGVSDYLGIEIRVDENESLYREVKRD